MTTTSCHLLRVATRQQRERGSRQHQRRIRGRHRIPLDRQPLVQSLRCRRYEPRRQRAAWSTFVCQRRRIASRRQRESGSDYARIGDDSRLQSTIHRQPPARSRLPESIGSMDPSSAHRREQIMSYEYLSVAPTSSAQERVSEGSGDGR